MRASKVRLPEHIFCRDLSAEAEVGIEDIRFYGYWPGGFITVTGDIISNKRINGLFQMVCTLYDHDQDVLTSEVYDFFGPGVVTSYISKEVFFSGFPFKFLISPQGFTMKDVAKIKVYPRPYVEEE